MTVNFKSVIRMMGIMLTVTGICLILPLIVAFVYKETLSAKSFFITIIPSLVAGGFILKFVPSGKKNFKATDGFLIVTMCWLIASVTGAVPLVLSGSVPSYIDAFFEICSGFSTTGSTILTDIEALPKSILFWRSFTHWLGGMGIVVLATALLPSIGIEGQLIASAETPGPTLDKLTPKFSDTARNLYLVYLLISVVEVILLFAGGLNFYDALVHTFGTVGTGGFSCYADSIAHFTSPYIQWVITFFMIICGINFNLYFVLGKKGMVAFFKDEELRLYLTVIAIVTILIFINLMASGVYTHVEEGLRASAFQVSSIITTTGYATADFDLWPAFSKMLLFLLLCTGACSSSTGGGIKMIRVLTAIKLVRRSISLKIHPNRIITVNVNKKEVPQEVATNIANFIFFYIFLIFAGSVLISFNGYDMVTTMSSVLTCLGNTGPGFALVGPSMNFAFYSDFSKLVLSFLMIAGRLELFTFFILFSRHYWNTNRV